MRRWRTRILYYIAGRSQKCSRNLLAPFQMDGAILVVSAADGPMPQTREHILLAKQVWQGGAATR